MIKQKINKELITEKLKGMYELPTGWRWVQLGEVCEINPCRTRHFTRSSDEPTTFIPMSAVNGKAGAIIKPEVVPYSKVSKGYTYFEENDVLFAKITPCMQNGKHVIARNLIDGSGFGTTEFHVLRPEDEILPEWIYFFISQPIFLKEATSYFTGAVGQQRVPKEFLSNYVIPLPPTSEQKRITKKIQELMQEIEHARTACENQLEAVKALPSAYLREVFESEEAKKWERKRLGEVCDIFSGSSAPQDEKYFVNGKYPFVRVQDLGRYSKTDNLHKIKDYINDTAIYELKLKKANKGTILFPKSGAAILTNNRAILGINAYFVSHLAALKPKDEILDTYFVYLWLCLTDMDQYMENPGYPSLKLYTISKIYIPFPSLGIQHNIISKIKEKMSEVEKLHTSIEKQLEAINALPQAIFRNAFRGEL